MRRPAAILLAALAGATFAAPARADVSASTAPPAALDVSTAAWQYAPDTGDRGRKQHWERGRGKPRWRTVRLPHVFDPEPHPSAFGGAVGWYRLQLYQPASTPRGFTWAARFDQVRRVAEVWLDGRRLAVNRDPYAPFTVPLPALRDGRRHALVVRVDSRKGPEVREGWWNWGGIVRPVRLVPLGALTTGAPGFLPQRTCDAGGTACRWSVLIDAMVVNRGRTALRPTLVARLDGPAGGSGGGDAPAGEATTAVRPLAPGEQARVRFRVPVSGPIELWQPGHPALYRATLETRAGPAIHQVDTARIGLRTVGVRDGLLVLNGRPVQLRGASIQEDVDGRGAALTDEDVADVVDKLRELGANVTRAHYALDERLARALDEAGILVWTQAPVYHADRLLETHAGRVRALDAVRAAVLATRNHPSTLTHSVANELSVVPDQVAGTRAFLRAARELTVDLDPTLPTAVDTLSYPGYAAQQAYAAFDLLGINAYFGWYPGKVDHSTASLADLGPYLQHMRTSYPRAGLVMTEFGAEATMDGPVGVKETYAFQADYARKVLDVVRAHPDISGAIYWTLQEFAVKPHWDGGAKRVGVPRDSIHNKALITYGGQRKPAWSIVRDDAARTPVFRTQAAVAAAAGVRLPRAESGPWPALGAAGILLLIAALLAVDAWALLGWRAAAAAAIRDARAETAGGDQAGGDTDGDGRPRLRLIA